MERREGASERGGGGDWAVVVDEEGGEEFGDDEGLLWPVGRLCLRDALLEGVAAALDVLDVVQQPIDARKQRGQGCSSGGQLR